MASTTDALGNWTGTQADSGLDVPESAEVFPGSLTVDDQKRQLRGSKPAGPVARVKDFDDDLEGLRAAHRDESVPATAAGEKVTVEGKKAESADDAAPLAAPATSEAPAEEVAKDGGTKGRGRTKVEK